jgi:ribosomal-protein-alanine N-acetyltransferase
MTTDVLPGRLGTDRVRLILFSREDVGDMLAGRRQDRWHPEYPQPTDVDAAAMRKASGAWGARHVVVDLRAVGSIGCVGAPVDGEVELAVSVVPSLRRRGIAREALGLVLRELDGLAVTARASVRPENVAAMKLLAGLGFTELREATGDGHLVLARPRPAT